MDIDMHYYGTYALARAAGIRADSAWVIATAAEFVDDATLTNVIVHPDGARFRGEPTGHHPLELEPNNDLDDQIRVWVPFHFLPGGEGNTQSKRLICRKDSAIAKQMVLRHLESYEAPYALALMGITAHVYADTFAHYGFSGVSSRVNRVLSQTLHALNGDPLSIPSLDQFFGKFGRQGGLVANFRTSIASFFGEGGAGALGHGSVATFPDQPYLEWQYSYEMPEHAGSTDIERQNAGDYEQAAEALHGVFREFVQKRPIFADHAGGFDFDDIRSRVRAIVRTVAPRQTRINAWKQSISDGRFSRGGGDQLPDYDHTEWRSQTDRLKDLERPELASAVPAYQFHQAAAIHRNYVLRDLLPHNNIFVL